MARLNRNIFRKRKLISSGLLALFFLSGCNLTIESTAPTTAPVISQGIQSRPETGGGDTQPASSPAFTAPSSDTAQRTGELALEKYKASRLGIQSEKMTHLWSVESSYPLKNGQIITEWNLGSSGTPETGRGSFQESYAGETDRTEWFMGPQEFIVTTEDATLRYPRSDLQSVDGYDMDALMGKLLLDYPVRLEGRSWRVRVTTQDPGEIQAILERLDYERPEEDYQGNLFMEALIDEETGYLETLNYVFENTSKGFKDNGQLTFSNRNVPVSYETGSDEGAEEPDDGTEGTDGAP